VSLARKDDVFDIDYLRMRLRYYDAIAKGFGFTVRDGTLPIAENAGWLLGEVAASARRPYVIYVHSNNVDIGGADKVLALMARHMRDYGRPEKGCRVAVALRLDTAIVDTYAEAGIPVMLHRFVRPQVSQGILGLVRLVLRAPGSLWFFWRLFGRERPDIVHVNDLYDFLPAFAARLRGIPVVWHIRMIPGSASLRRGLGGVLGFAASRVVFISRAVESFFPTVSAARSQVIYDFSDVRLSEGAAAAFDPAPRPAPLPQGGRLVVMVGRVEPWKGQDVFVDAVALLPEELRRKHVFALVGGQVPGKEDYFEQVALKAGEHGIHVLGARNDVPSILRSADVCVHCSVTPEPLGAVVLESMLAGAATVATNQGGVPEIIQTEAQGILLPPARPDLLAGVLMDLLEAEVPPRVRYAKAGYDRVSQLVDKTRICAELTSLYAEVIPNRISLI
jgi:glycosyltransferase involved in cell wall biosynthesis